MGGIPVDLLKEVGGSSDLEAQWCNRHVQRTPIEPGQIESPPLKMGRLGEEGAGSVRASWVAPGRNAVTWYDHSLDADPSTCGRHWSEACPTWAKHTSQDRTPLRGPVRPPIHSRRCGAVLGAPEARAAGRRSSPTEISDAIGARNGHCFAASATTRSNTCNTVRYGRSTVPANSPTMSACMSAKSRSRCRSGRRRWSE